MTPSEARIEYERRQARDAWRRAEAAATPGEALGWLDRAHRFVPGDQNIAFSLALTRLAVGDAPCALELFSDIASRHPTREVRCGIAAAYLAMGLAAQASAEIGRALAASAPNEVLASLARRVAGAGWCGLRNDGRPVFEAISPVTFRLDGRAARLTDDGALPGKWVRARRLGAFTRNAELLGSPIDIAAIRRTEGVVELTEDGIAGWAWQPGAPDTDPELTVIAAGGRLRVTAGDLSVSLRGTSPLARPRGFRQALDTSRPVRVLGRDGRDLLGSPLGGSAAAPPAPWPRGLAGTAVIVPAYRGAADTLACIESVLATIGRDDLVIVVNDASPEPVLAAALRRLAAREQIILLTACATSRQRNVGFPAAANVGLRAARGRDAVLLNSDTMVFRGWLAALRAAVHSAPDIGTATPIGNDATIFSYPDPTAPAPMPDAESGTALARMAAAENRDVLVDVPTGHGFCLYIRGDCLHHTGLLRANLFAQGYGEENDFTERARQLGWRHVAVPAVYVAHRGGASFGAAREHLLARNGAILQRLHPDYADRVAAFVKADPLLPARRRIDAARWRLAAGAHARGAVLLISHGGIGGTTRVVAERCEAARAAGRRPVLLRGRDGRTAVDGAEGFPNLRFELPAELPVLIQLLAAARPVAAEIHHLRDQDLGVLRLLDRFAIPFDVWVHDYLWLCPRLSLVTGEGRFCGEPPAEACVACVARWGDGLEAPVGAAVLRAMSTDLLARAGQVVVPSEDVAARIRRHFPAACVVVRPWEADPPYRAAVAPAAGPLRVAVVGAIGLEKGFYTLLECARDAAARGLALHFHVVGYTEDDEPLLATGHVSITGPFEAGTSRQLLAAAAADIALLPSIWPETWCYALSDAWEAGLDVAVFDIGTPAERVRRTGRGWVLPLNLPPSRVNDVLLNLQALAGRPAY